MSKKLLLSTISTLTILNILNIDNICLLYTSDAADE